MKSFQKLVLKQPLPQGFFTEKRSLPWSFGIFIFSVCILNAQVDSPNAIGIRIGENDGFRNEITYQVLVSDMNRVETNFGYRTNPDYEVFKATALFQWVGL